MSLVEDVRTIQRAVGAEVDGVFGPESARKVLEHLARVELVAPVGETPTLLDARTVATIATLDAKAQPVFHEFALRAKATAATFGCDYVAISGNRSWEEQDALYARGRTALGGIVTNAKGGQSNHNFGIAADFAVFYGKVYADETKPGLAAAVHAACAVHARELGMDWGGDWKALKDTPHFELRTGLTLAQKRNVYQARGSVL